MNVLIDARLLTKRKTGIGTYIENLIKSYLDKEDYESITLLVHSKDEMPKEITSNKQIIITNRKTFLIWDILLLSINLYFKNYDIIHFPTYVGILFKSKDTKIINTVHDIYYHLTPKYFSKRVIINYFKRAYFDVIIRGSLNTSCYIYSVSKTTASDLKNVFGFESRITLNGYDRQNLLKLNTEVFKSPYQPNSFYLYVGNLRSNKNIEFLLECFKEYSEFPLLIAGNYDNIPFKHIPANVHFIGYQNEKSLVELYTNARAFIFPSLYEGFGLPILEALSHHTIVLSSNSGSLSEFENPNIKFFNPKVKEELIELLKKDFEYDHKYNEEEFFLKYNWTNNLELIHEMNRKTKSKMKKTEL